MAFMNYFYRSKCLFSFYFHGWCYWELLFYNLLVKCVVLYFSSAVILSTNHRLKCAISIVSVRELLLVFAWCFDKEKPFHYTMS